MKSSGSTFSGILRIFLAATASNAAIQQVPRPKSVAASIGPLWRYPHHIILPSLRVQDSERTVQAHITRVLVTVCVVNTLQFFCFPSVFMTIKQNGCLLTAVGARRAAFNTFSNFSSSAAFDL